MKNLNKASIVRLFYVGCIVLIFNSCAKEETSDFENQTLETLEVDSPVIMDSGDESSDNTKSSSSTTAKTTCDISGTSSPTAGNQYSFTYTSNILNPTVTWTVESGAISLVSSSGNTATFQFSSSFNGGSIKAHGTNGSVECSDIKSFSSAPSVSCPQQSCLNVFEVEPCLDFQAVLGCANDVVSVDWEYSIGPYSHVSFGTTTNPNGNYSMTKPLYLPSGSWDNYYLWVFADITLSDNSTCSLSKRILLSCSSGGGGNQ